MKKEFKDILEIARGNVRTNPCIMGKNMHTVTMRYLQGLLSEVEEVCDEITEDNEIYLVDELSDIVWDFAVLIAILEDRKLIQNAEDVFERGFQKYTERAPAFLEESNDLWIV